MSVLVYAEQGQGKFRKSVAEVVSQGRRVADFLKSRLLVCLIGSGVSHLTGPLVRWGADEIFLADDEKLSFYQTETYAAVLTSAIEEIKPRLVMLAHTALGKDLAPRVAERVGAGLVSDCIAMETRPAEIHFLRPMYSGKVLARVKIHTPIKMATLRPNNFPVEEKSGLGEIRVFSPPVPIPRAQVRKLEIQEEGRPELTEAEIIVSGGRGLGRKEGFQSIEQLADALGAAVGASRAAVDAGWRSNQNQVGLTGKVVTPNLYIACGIFGAIQHLAGMGSSRCIVAINKDPEANIMKIADFALAGDLYEVIPQLLRKIKELDKKD